MGKIQEWWVGIKVTLAAVLGILGVAWYIFWRGMRSGKEDAAAKQRTKEKLDRIGKQVKTGDTDSLKQDGINWAKRWDK